MAPQVLQVPRVQRGPMALTGLQVLRDHKAQRVLMVQTALMEPQVQQDLKEPQELQAQRGPMALTGLQVLMAPQVQQVLQDLKVHKD